MWHVTGIYIYFIYASFTTTATKCAGCYLVRWNRGLRSTFLPSFFFLRTIVTKLRIIPSAGESIICIPIHRVNPIIAIRSTIWSARVDFELTCWSENWQVPVTSEAFGAGQRPLKFGRARQVLSRHKNIIRTCPTLSMIKFFLVQS